MVFAFAARHRQQQTQPGPAHACPARARPARASLTLYTYRPWLAVFRRGTLGWLRQSSPQPSLCVNSISHRPPLRRSPPSSELGDRMRYQDYVEAKRGMERPEKRRKRERQATVDRFDAAREYNEYRKPQAPPPSLLRPQAVRAAVAVSSGHRLGSLTQAV
eukprot:scaffold26416_cov112-Isochrysis_galbana.AAC.1